jgi:hypothetical protein
MKEGLLEFHLLTLCKFEVQSQLQVWLRCSPVAERLPSWHEALGW